MAGRFCLTVLVIFFLSVSLVVRTDADESDVTSEEAALQRNLERAILDAGLNDCATRGVNVNHPDGDMHRHGKVQTARRRRRKYYGHGGLPPEQNGEHSKRSWFHVPVS